MPTTPSNPSQTLLDLRLADSLPHAVWVRSADGRILFANRFYREFFGIGPGEPIDEEWEAPLHPDDLPGYRAAWAAAIENFTPLRYQARARRHDGVWRWIETRAEPQRSETGEFVAFVGMSLDITERRKGEEALATLAAIVETADDAIVSKGLDGIIRSWNKGAERLFGYTAAEAVGQPILLIIPPDRREEEQHIIARLQRGERIEHFETVRIAKDGRQLDISLSVSPVRDSMGRIIGASKIARDITERKRSERLLRDSTEALERANAELERFVSIASHDLKEPLRGMSLLVSFLLEEEPGITDSGRARLDRLRVLCQRLTLMVNGLLEYARTGAMRESQPCDLETAARDAADKLAEQIEAEQAEVIIHGPLPTIVGDPVMLERMFANLIANGIRHNTSAHKRVEIGCLHLPEVGRDEPHIYIRDNGIGIDSRHHDRIFSLFSRVRSDEGERVRLGLALVSNIVRTHRGRIWVESRPGEGSTFYLRFPSASASPQPSGQDDQATTGAV